jgi:hypothetical protein
MAAGRVLAGEAGQVCLDLARLERCRACIAAGYGSSSEQPEPVPQDRMIWILEGFVEVHTIDGVAIDVSQGESAILAGGVPYRLVFPQLALYLLVEPLE